MQENTNKYWYAHIQAALADDSNSLPLKSTANKRSLPDELFAGWDTLSKSDKLKALKDTDYTCYCVLYFDRYGKYPQGANDKVDFNTRSLYADALTQFKIAEMNKMSWDELTKKNLTPLLKKLDANGYANKYQEKFGVAPAFK